MFRLWLSTLLVVNWFVVELGFANPLQVPQEVQTTKPKKLRGRFLHITDMHPDPYYVPKTAESTACHRKKKKKKKNIAGIYGTPYSNCDSPFQLTNFTLDFLKENWAKEIDFVIWTGDSARHDNDRKIPRTPSEIYDLNRAMASRMNKIFHSKGIPVVPTLGNNDVWPHNIMVAGRFYYSYAAMLEADFHAGPNSITAEYSSIWSSFIPFPYLQVFHRGAYFATEVIPGKVAVISLNTMYFYESNKVVSGCLYKDRNDPGNLEFDWLEVQLDTYRKEGLQVWIIGSSFFLRMRHVWLIDSVAGHVPPSRGNYFPECYVRYVELALRFQDTILGHLYGHMNADHFFFLEGRDLRIGPDKEEEEFSERGLLKRLFKEFGRLPKKPKESEYAVVNVAPSVVPNPYVPAFRIYTYNTTGGGRRRGREEKGERRERDKRCKSEEYADTWRCHLDEAWHSDGESPSRSNGEWTGLGYAQYYIPRLGRPRVELEYVTHRISALEGGGVIPRRLLPKELGSYVEYKMADLTIGSWIRLGEEIGRGGLLQRTFRKYMLMR